MKVESSSVMTVEKFVDAESIDPMYYDASYFLAPDGKAGEDVYTVLREAITNTGKVAISRIVIAQRERTIALRPMSSGLMAHTLYQERDLNSPEELFDGTTELKLDPEMVALALQLIQRQSGSYDPSDLEDRYETRLRAMLDAKGFSLQEDDPQFIDQSNIIDLMAALKKSLGSKESEKRSSACINSKAEESPRSRACAAFAQAAHQGRQRDCYRC